MGIQEPRWSVTGAGWKDLRPDLSDEVIALLATPVVASVDDPDQPEDEERYPSPSEPCAVTPYGQRVARFLPPTAMAGRAAA
jgi:hypothetical protein